MLALNYNSEIITEMYFNHFAKNPNIHLRDKDYIWVTVEKNGSNYKMEMARIINLQRIVVLINIGRLMTQNDGAHQYDPFDPGI